MATTALLGLWAQTSIHAGAGSSIDGIDLPIQREAHNAWPCVFGSSVKGALRAKAEDLWGSKNDGVRYIFGPDSSNEEDEDNKKPKASDHAGALMVSDARLLLLPVRSLTGYFKWVTCPALLKRLQNDAQCFDVAIDDYDISVVTELESGLQSTPNEEKIALFHQPEPQQQNGNLFLEEYRLTTKGENLSRIIKCLQTLSAIAEADLQKQLVIVDDDMFTHLCKFATPVTAHIAIDNTKKIVKTGMLWYEETLPPETVFYLVLKANAVRDAQAKFDDNSIVKDSKAEAVLASITDSLLDLSVFKNLKGLDETVSPKKGSPYLQIGGNETVGMGWCKVTNYKGA